ncbi:transcription initiation factor IIB-2-like [Amaranthus tricolor]|uniref:transcription initiation factor IIB-2-like n=1 Tax=Amaranthus tricolor TaxID=29722 RepID=UPI00258DF8BA|nr:transcription initiation factor IIB-2-like [Amaranthus tricolor]
MTYFFCNDCKACTPIVIDNRLGQTICSICGLLLDQFHLVSVNETSEFENDSNTNPDTIGGPTNDSNRIESDANPSPDKISDPRNDSILKSGIADSKIISRNKKTDRLSDGFERIESMAKKLSLDSAITHRAKKIFKKLYENHHSRGKSNDIFPAACIFFVCRQEKNPRTLKEICFVLEDGISAMKSIVKENSYIEHHLNKNTPVIGENKIASAADYVKRFCTNLGILYDRDIKAAFEAAQNSEKIDIRRSPPSLAAAMIYIVCFFLKKPKPLSLKNIAVVSSVAEGTIRSVCKDVKPHLPKIIPTWFAEKDELLKASFPDSI